MHLVVELPSAAHQWRYVLMNDAMEAVQQGECTADLLPHAARVTASIPSEQVAWHAVSLPKQTGGRLRAVLEGLLEEALLDEPGALYLAVAGESLRSNDGHRWVMCCDASWLREQLEALQQAGRQPNWLMTSQSPSVDGSWATWQRDGENAQVRWRSHLGVWLQDATTAAQLNQDVQHAAEPAAIAAAEQHLSRKVPATSWAEQLVSASQPSERERIGNLAQFEFAHFGNLTLPQKLAAGMSSLAFAPHWRAMRWGLAALLIANVVGLQLAAFQQRKAISAKREAATALVTKTFPEVRVVLDAPLQMQRLVETQRVRGGQLSSSDFEVVLSTWAQSQSKGPTMSTVPQQLEYRDGQLKVTPANTTVNTTVNKP